MSLQEPLRTVGAARAELARIRADSAGWSDELRARFDAARLEPLMEAGTAMGLALQKAQESWDAAERLRT